MRRWRLFQARMRLMLRTIKERGPPSPDDVSIAAHLLRLKDPLSGGPLSDERLLPEIATLFVAGTDTTAHTSAWTLVRLGLSAGHWGVGTFFLSEYAIPYDICRLRCSTWFPSTPR